MSSQTLGFEAISKTIFKEDDMIIKYHYSMTYLYYIIIVVKCLKVLK